MEIAATVFLTDKYIASMKKCFVEVGQFPKADGSFNIYSHHSKGSLLKNLLPESAPEEPTTLATLTTGVEVAPMEDEDEPESSDEEPEE